MWYPPAMKTSPPAITRPADVLLDPLAAPGDQLAAAHALRDALASLAGWSEEDPGVGVEVAVAGGIAICPLDATRCIPEYRRTAGFLQGLAAAIDDAAARCEGVVDVLYAGCGPLAPLALALVHRAPRARFWPVDIHPENVACVRRLVAAAGLEEHFGAIVAADASGHRWPVAGHVAVAEVMQRGLEKEPQIAVTANLADQLRPEGRLVPERIVLEVLLFDTAAEFAAAAAGAEPPPPRVRVPVAPLLALDRRSAAALRDGAAVEFGYEEPAGLQVLVSTRIEVHGDLILRDYECSLTLPWVAHDLGRSGPGRRGRIRYVSGPSPRLAAEPLAC